MSEKGFFVLGATHHTAPLAIRERLSFSAEAVRDLSVELKQMAGLHEFTLLNTCNRLEFYGVASDAAAAVRVQAAICAKQHFDPVEFAQFRLQLHGIDAIQHLLNVA